MRKTSLSFHLVAGVCVSTLVACSNGSTSGGDAGTDGRDATSTNDATPGTDMGASPSDTGSPTGDVVVPHDVLPTTDTGTVCPSGQTACAGVCFDLTTSMLNCGACGHSCPTGQPCVASACYIAPGTCPAPPAGITANALAAITLENQVRHAMGLGCATMVTTANLSAARHCAYYAANASNATCIADPHTEVASCSMYTAANFWTRMTDAGYTGSPAFEDMAFQDDGMAATQQWIDSIWHRTPILSPWVADVGYGSATACDTMDFGTGAAAADSVVATYPYAAQTRVPTSFNGNYEGPPPPAPPSGWPSGYPIHVYARGATIATHVLTVQSSGAVVAHQWVGGASDTRAMGLLNDEYVMYANTPLTSGTTYRVQVTGTHTGGALALDWTFTTQ